MAPDWLAAEGLEHLARYLTALGIGLLIGLERERNPTAKAGLRTCALVALAGALSAALAEVLGPVLATGLAAGAVAFAIGQRRDGAPQELTMPPIANPAELRSALGFALLCAGVLLLVAGLDALIGARGVYAVALASGLADVDAITLSSLRLYGLGSLAPAQVAIAVVLAVSANAVFKLAVVRAVGGGALLRRCLPAVVAMIAGAALGAAVFA